MARAYASGDDDNTVLRKILENDASTIAGTSSVSITTAGGSAAPQEYKIGDSKNDMLRKILVNQSQVIAGNMTLHIR